MMNTDCLPPDHYMVIDAMNEAVREGRYFTYYDVWKAHTIQKRRSRY